MTQIIGHRGWRGKFPENSLIGFDQLFHLGIHAVELDIVITKDKQILVSHEPWFDLRYCTHPHSSNLFDLTLTEIQKVDCGLKFDNRFPEQQKLASIKPTLKAVLELWDFLGVKPSIALEVKSESKLYGSHQPFAQEFAELLINFEEQFLKEYDYFVQSFDSFFLKTYHHLNPSRATGLLIENKASLYADLELLSYKPNFYNPEHILFCDKLMQDLSSEKIESYTWTVNSIEDYNKIKDYPLKGIISDYPELFL
jgi:glycerophosphoryl diester phosphodiesterase